MHYLQNWLWKCKFWYFLKFNFKRSPDFKYLGLRIGRLLILSYLVGVKESPSNTKTCTIGTKE